MRNDDSKTSWTNPLASALDRELQNVANEVRGIPNAVDGIAVDAKIALKEKCNELGTSIARKKSEVSDKVKDLLPTEIDEWIDVMTERLDKYEIARNEYLADYDRSPQTFRFYRDVILPFCENTLIMDSIARTEGASYTEDDPTKNKLSIRVFVVNACGSLEELKASYPELCAYNPRSQPDSTQPSKCERKIDYPDYFPYLFTGKGEGKKKIKLADALNTRKIDTDLEVLLNSEQAIYSILENYIRNAAKHNKAEVSKNGLEIRLHLEHDEDRYRLTISDNVSKLNNDGLNKLCERIKSSVNFGDGSSPMENLGFADICINSFLMRWSASDIDQGSDKSLLDGNCRLVVIKECTESSFKWKEIPEKTVDSEDKREFAFGIQMDILKPKTVLWIGDDVDFNGTSISEWANQGIIHHTTMGEFLEAGSDDAKEIAAFEFVVFFGEFHADDYLKQQHRLPARVLILDVNDHASTIPNKPNFVRGELDSSKISDAAGLRRSCWETWLAYRNKGTTDVYIYFDGDAAGCDGFNNLQNGVKLAGESISIKGISETQPKNKITFPAANRLIVFDHHGRTNDKLENLETRDFYLQDTKIVFDKGSDDFNNLSSLPADPERRDLLLMRLVDAATTNIFVLDERIAERALKDVGNQNDKVVGKSPSIFTNTNTANVFQSLAYGKVFLLNHIMRENIATPIAANPTGDLISSLNIDNDALSVSLQFGDEDGNVENGPDSEFINGFSELRKDILVIHRTYLTKDHTGFESPKDFIEAAQKVFGSVVVTSGGGYPHSLGDKTEVRFLPFSIIDRCLGSRLSKLKLVSSLQSCSY